MSRDIEYECAGASVAGLHIPDRLHTTPTLRLAVMVSTRFTQTNGGTQASAMAAIASTVNATNAVYERDLSIHFNIVKMIVFNNPSQEPFPLEQADLEDLHRLIDQQTGTANYDVGHTFTATNGGLAALQSACNDAIKAAGVSAQGGTLRPSLAWSR